MERFKPEIPLNELQRRYESLGKIEEMAGERTFLSRCGSWDDFLYYVPFLVDDLNAGRNHKYLDEHAPGLKELCMDAWPGGTLLKC